MSGQGAESDPGRLSSSLALLLPDAPMADSVLPPPPRASVERAHTQRKGRACSARRHRDGTDSRALSNECVVLTDGRPGACFLYLFFFKFESLKKNQAVDNCMHYDCTKFYFEILCIVSSAKITRNQMKA
jgi:hypothetical protein